MADDCKGNFTHGVCLESLSCRFIMMVPRENRCSFSDDIEDCRSENTLFQYMSFLACKCNNTDDQMYYCCLLFVCHLFYYFFIMVLLAEFFTPSLCYISNVLGMSENLAGATLLALGNGAPDMMTTMVEATTLGPEIVLTQVMGTTMHVTTMVVAIVLLVQPFSMKPWPFVRTIFPVLVVLIWISIRYGTGIVYLWDPFVFLALFLGYLAMYCLQECCMRRPKERTSTMRSSGDTGAEDAKRASKIPKEEVMKIEEAKPSPSDASEHPVTALMQEMMEGERTEREEVEIERRKESLERMGIDLPPPVIARDKPAPLTGGITAALQVERQQGLHMLGLDEQAREEAVGHPTTVGVEIEGQVVYWKSRGMWRDFCRHINPIDDDFWTEARVVHKMLHLVEAPLLYALRLLIPYVHEGVLCNNWCKLLACIHCFSVPLVFLWTFSVWKLRFLAMVVVLSVTGALTLLTAIVVLRTSSVRRAPSYHIVFACVGIIVTIVIMYVIINEVVAIVRALGSVYGLSTPILCITVLPWGNSIEDVMNGVHLAHAGYAKMAVAGAFGTAFMVMVVGLFIATLFIVVFSGSNDKYTYVPHEKTLVYTAITFAAIINTTTLLVVPTMNYTLRKSYAIFLIVADIMFIGMCALIEAEVV